MIHKFHFNESVVGLLSATDFFYFAVNFSTGEIRKNRKDFYLCLAIVEKVATNKHKKKYLSSDALREIKVKFHPLLKAIIDNNILLIIKEATSKSATQVELNPIFAGECSLNLTKEQIDLVNTRFIKEKRRGTKATTQKDISIDITYSSFYKLMIENDKTHDTIISQWLIISRINRTKKINPRQKSHGRLYSDITALTSLIHPYLKIDGNTCVEIDQHATYWTLLPKLLNDTILLSDNNIHEELLKDIEKLHIFISNTKNIYTQIGIDTNQQLDKIKKDTISFICDPNKYSSNKTKIIIKEWFKNNFPFCSYHLDNLRRNNLVSYRIQEIESKIFVSAAKELNKNGIACFTKHDSLIVTKDSAKSAEATINKYMKKYNIPNKIRDKVLESNRCHTPLSYDSSKLPCVSPEECKGDTKESYPHKEGEERKTIRVTFAANTSGSPILSASQGYIDGDIPQFPPLKPTMLRPTVKKTRQSKSSIGILTDGRYYTTYKGKTIPATTGESKQSSKSRIEKEFPNILWKQ